MPWWRITKKNADLDRELRSDLELEEEEQRERGLSSKEARYAAVRAFGNTTLIREQTQATWSWSWLESFAGDLKYGFRGMRRNVGSTVFAMRCCYVRCHSAIRVSWYGFPMEKTTAPKPNTMQTCATRISPSPI
jgi:hypothetical protein